MNVYLDQLFEFSAIAITLTGFSALISVIGTTRHVSGRSVDMFRALLLVVCGIVTVSAMLLPSVLVHFLADDDVWRVSATVMVAAAVPLCIWGFAWLRRHHQSLTVFDKYITGSVYAFSTALIGALFAIIFRIATSLGAVYVLAMFLAMIVLSLFFTGIAMSILLPEINDSQS